MVNYVTLVTPFCFPPLIVMCMILNPGSWLGQVVDKGTSYVGWVKGSSCWDVIYYLFIWILHHLVSIYRILTLDMFLPIVETT